MQLNRLFSIAFIFTTTLCLAHHNLNAQTRPGESDEGIIRTVRNNGVDGSNVLYQLPAFTTVEKRVDNQPYHYVHIKGMGKLREPGKPALPALSEMVAMPYNSQATLSFSSESYTDYPGMMIHPALQPALDTYGAPEPVFELDSALYSTDAFFPEHLVEIADTILIRGMRVVVVRVQPIQFNPVRNLLRVHQGVRFELAFSGPGRSFEPLTHQSSSAFLAGLSNSFLNSESLPLSTSKHTIQERADYLIITIDNYKPAADSLARWKRQMGYTTHIISKPSWAMAAVRDSVHACYKRWLPRPDYLVIIGDHNHVPAQMFPSGNTNYPTDLYFVCMDGSVDNFPDMAKGRISVSNATEAMNTVLKMVNYERYPVTDTLFYQNALHCAQFQDDDTSGYATRRFAHTSEELRDYVMTQGFDVQRIYYTDSWVTPTNYNNGYYSNGEPIPPALLRANGHAWNGGQNDIAQAINAGKFYVLHRDHGYVGGSGWAHPYFTKTSMNMLNNGNKLPVVFSINCHTGEFSLAECFAEKFIRMPNAGAVGVFAASFASYSGFNDALTAGFFDAIWNNPGILPVFGSGGKPNPAVSAHPPILNMGYVMNHGLLRMIQTWNGSAGNNTYQQRLFHYFGDPAMRMFTANPAALYANIPDTVAVGSTFLSLVGLNTGGVTASVVYNGELLYANLLDSGNSVLYFSPLTDTAYRAIVTLTKNNHRPFIKEVYVAMQQTALNDLPCTPADLPVKAYCDPLPSGFAGAGVSSVPNPGCATANAADVWFRFVVPSSGKAEAEVHTSTGLLGLSAYSGSCSNPVLISCNTSFSTGKLQLTIYNQFAGDTVLLRVWQNATGAPATFDICVREPDSFAYAGIPYYTGFENGLDTFWQLKSSNSAGRIRIDSSCAARSGTKSLVMDQNVNGTYAQNEAWLRLNLRDKNNVKIRFWWREYGDENNTQDGVFMSDDGGNTFTKAIELRGSFEAWTQYLVSLDELAKMHGLKLTESFVVKFQQYDNWGFICNNPTGGDGFAFDDIDVYVDTTMHQHSGIPYYTGFENGFDKYWSLNSSRSQGRIVATGILSPFAGNVHLTMDLSLGSEYIRNDVDLRLNLAGLQGLVLSFRWKSFGDESHLEDGLYFSDNGGTDFVKVASLTDTNTYWSHKNFNINALAAANNLNTGSNFVIRFTQYDNGSMTTDGMAFDEIEVYQSAFPLIDLNMISLSFATDTGQIQLKNFRIINQGTDTLRIDSLSIPNAYSTTFASPHNLMPGDSVSVPLSFAPDSVGSFTGLVRVFHNAGMGLDSLWLSGLGMYREVVPDLFSVDFDTLPIVTADTIEFSITNIGNGNIRLNSVTVPSNYTVLSNTNLNIAPGQSRPVRIRFLPYLAGVYAGNVVINTDANNLTIPIKGVAVNHNSVEETALKTLYSVRPNPFSDELYIDNPGKESIGVFLYDIAGKLLYSAETAETLSIPVSHLSAGMYLLEIRSHEVVRVKLSKI